MRQAGIALRPSLVSFTPWTTLDDYIDVFDVVEREGLIDHVDPVQYAVRLLIPPGSCCCSGRRYNRSWGAGSGHLAIDGPTLILVWMNCIVL